MLEESESKCGNGLDVLILAVGEIVKCKIVELGCPPIFDKVTIKDRKRAKLYYLLIINGTDSRWGEGLAGEE